MSNIQINPRKMFLLAIVAVFAVSLAVPTIGVFGVTSASHVNVFTKSSYSGTTTINVRGTVTPMPAKGTIATIVIYDPHHVKVVSGTTAVVHGVFMIPFTSGGSLWKLSGMYTVKATVGTTTGSTTFMYTA